MWLASTIPTAGVFFQGMADPHVGGEGIGQLHETASGGTGSVDTVMHELGAGEGDGNAAGQQVPAVADAAGAIEREENERLRREADSRRRGWQEAVRRQIYMLRAQLWSVVV